MFLRTRSVWISLEICQKLVNKYKKTSERVQCHASKNSSCDTEHRWSRRRTASTVCLTSRWWEMGNVTFFGLRTYNSMQESRNNINLIPRFQKQSARPLGTKVYNVLFVPRRRLTTTTVFLTATCWKMGNVTARLQVHGLLAWELTTVIAIFLHFLRQSTKYVHWNMQ